ncbi:MAG: hypothetical protein ABI707_17745, partial [Ferruginibacter sp.]
MKIFKFLTVSLFILMFIFGVATPSVAQLQFIENKGQWDSKVNFKADIQTGAFFIEQKGFTVLQHNTADLEKLASLAHNHLPSESAAGNTNTGERRSIPPNQNFTLHSHAYRVSFLGAIKSVVALPDKALPTYNNYFLGNDKS